MAVREPAVAKASHRKVNEETRYFAPKQLAERWACSRSAVDDIVKRAGISRVYLGEGRNGMVRIPCHEVYAYEESRRVGGGDAAAS